MSYEEEDACHLTRLFPYHVHHINLFFFITMSGHDKYVFLLLYQVTVIVFLLHGDHDKCVPHIPVSGFRV